MRVKRGDRYKKYFINFNKTKIACQFLPGENGGGHLAGFPGKWSDGT